MVALAPEIVAIPTTRESVPAKWLIPMDDRAHRQFDFLLRNVSISAEALDAFPKLRARYRVFDGFRRLTGGRAGGALGEPLRKFGWFVLPLARFSSFLAWLKSDQQPIATKQP
jgi:hypothetical protein